MVVIFSGSMLAFANSAQTEIVENVIVQDEATYQVIRNTSDEELKVVAEGDDGFSVTSTYNDKTNTIEIVCYRNGVVEKTLSIEVDNSPIVQPKSSNYIYTKPGELWAWRLDTRSTNNYYGIKTPRSDFTTPAINPNGNSVHQKIISSAMTWKTYVEEFNNMVASDITSLTGGNIKVLDHVPAIQNILEQGSMEEFSKASDYEILFNTAVLIYLEHNSIIVSIINFTSSAAAVLNLATSKIQKNIRDLCNQL